MCHEYKCIIFHKYIIEHTHVHNIYIYTCVYDTRYYIIIKCIIIIHYRARNRPLKGAGDRLLCHSHRAAINVINRVRRQLFNTVFDLRGDNDPVTLFYVCIWYYYVRGHNVCGKAEDRPYREQIVTCGVCCTIIYIMLYYIPI